ncbi:MAG: stalk domain-containing protein [Tumebacillaceae bacterium]
MTRKSKRHRPFIALLLAFALAVAVPPPIAGAADRPAASKLESGYLLIGTFLIRKDALTLPVFEMAKASMEESGQGMYYKSELADGAWFNIKKGGDIKAILMGEGVVVPEAEVDKMKLAVWVSMEGDKQKFTLLWTQEELAKKLDKLNKQLTAAADNTLQVVSIKAEIAFWEALKSGDSQGAAEGLEQKSDPLASLPSSADEVIAATKQDGDKALAALSSAVARSDAKEAAAQLAALNEAAAKLQATREALLQMSRAALVSEKAKLEATLQDIRERKNDLQKENVALQAILKTANKVGEAEIAGELLVKITANASQLPALREAEKQNRVALLELEQPKSVHVEALLRSENLGIAQKIADLEDARYKLSLEIEQGMDELGEDLRAVEQNLAKTQQEELIIEKHLTEEQPSSPERDQHLADVIPQILALEKKKYSAADLAGLDAVSQQITAALGKQGQVLPVENVYSKDVEIKFQVPAVVIDGRAYIHIRPISEAFGSTVIWSDEEQSVTINRGETVVHCRIGDEAAYINDRKVKLDAAPRLIAERTFVPLRFVMDALGLDVQWDEASQSIEIKGIVK